MDNMQQPITENPVRPKKDHAMLSLILGLIGIIAWIIPIIGFPVTIIGLVYGVNSLKGSRRGIALAGTILCIVFLLTTTVNSISGAYQGATGQLGGDPDWNTSDVNIATNGNITVALKVLKDVTPEELRANAVAADPELVMKAPWQYYGQFLKFSGTVAIVQEYPPNSDEANAMNGGEQCGEIVFPAEGAPTVIIDYALLDGTGDLKVGDYVTVYGLVVGHVDVGNMLGGTTTELSVVGKAFDKQPSPPPEQEQSVGEAPEETLGEDEQTASQDEPEQAAESDSGNIYIPGLAAADIKINLEQTWGIQFTGPEIGEELAQDNGEAVDPDTGAVLTCTIFEDSPLNIQWVDFMVDASPVIGLIDVDTINSLTEGYFGYCATIPYDGADPEKAKQWIADNAKKAIKPGTVLSTQIGSVSFEMFGTEYMRTLRIKPVAE